MDGYIAGSAADTLDGNMALLIHGQSVGKAKIKIWLGECYGGVWFFRLYQRVARCGISWELGFRVLCGGIRQLQHSSAEPGNHKLLCVFIGHQPRGIRRGFIRVQVGFRRRP